MIYLTSLDPRVRGFAGAGCACAALSFEGLSAAAPPLPPALAFASPILLVLGVAITITDEPAPVEPATVCCRPRPFGAIMTMLARLASAQI